MTSERLTGLSYTGLFWFSEDHGTIIHSEGDNEFSENDLVSKRTILPDGTHRSFSVGSPYSLPRGRIEVEGGKVIITVGENCPDSAVEKVIGEYGLDKFRSVIEVRRNKFWDKRMQRNVMKSGGSCI